MRRPAAILSGVVLAAACFAALVFLEAHAEEGSRQSTAGNPPVKIGLIASLTGAAAGTSRELVNGFKLYLNRCHYRLGGRPVELIVESDDSSPAQGMAKFRKLAEQDKVDLVCGLQLSNVALAVSPLAEKFKIPLVIATAGADDLTQRKASTYTLRTSGSVSQPLHPFGRWVHDKLGYKRVATIAVDFAFGWECIGGFQHSFEDAGGQVVQKLWVPYGFTDYTYALKKVRPDVDAIFIAASGQSAQIIPKQLRELGFTMPMLGAGSSFDEAVLPSIGDSAQGAYSSYFYCNALDTPSNKTFVAAYRQAYKCEAGSYAEGGYTSAMWIDRALTALKGDTSDKAALLAALKKVELNDAPRGGPMKLDQYCNPIENIYVRRAQMVNGHIRNTVVETFKNVSQFWQWSPQDYLKQPVYSPANPPCTHCQDSK